LTKSEPAFHAEIISVAVENHQQGATEQVPAGVDHAGHFFLAQDPGKPLGHSWIRDELPELGTLQRAHVEEPQCGDVVLDRTRIQLARLQQISLIRSYVLQAKTVPRLGDEAGEILHPAQVVADRGVSIVAALEFFQHDLA